MAKFDWKKFSNVGDHLVKFSNDEEYQRSAMGVIIMLVLV